MKFNLSKMNIYAYDYAQTKKIIKEADCWEDLLDILVKIGFEQAFALHAKLDARDRKMNERENYLKKVYERYVTLEEEVKEKIKDKVEKEMYY